MVNTNVESHSIVCGSCRREYNIIADRNDMEAWLSGDKYIQDALSYLSASERELLLTQTCNDCFEKMFDNDE
jgi:hypothetical protein